MSTLLSLAEQHFQDSLGVGFDALLAPISEQAVCGQSLRHSPCYPALQEARRQDDLSLPLGTWQRDLKRADWGEVSRGIALALQRECKDMQLLAWLLEAQIRRHGIAGIAPTLVLIRVMCLHFWEQLHPQVTDGDVEHRANIISTLAEKNLRAIRLAPLIGIGQEHSYSWSDWEQAQLNEQIKTANSKASLDSESLTLKELQSAVSGASTESYSTLRSDLRNALQSITELSAALDPLFGEYAPGMGNMTQLLLQICALVEGELYKRGVRLDTEVSREQEQDAVSPELVDGATPASPATQGNVFMHTSGAIRDRADAYARLAETAEFLMRLEPHSPVPYLVRRATEWGSLNTVELYQELFLRLNGQLNIFEMLGLAQSENAN